MSHPAGGFCFAYHVPIDDAEPWQITVVILNCSHDLIALIAPLTTNDDEPAVYLWKFLEEEA